MVLITIVCVPLRVYTMPDALMYDPTKGINLSRWLESGISSEIGKYISPLFVRIMSGDPRLAHAKAHFKLKSVAVLSWFWIGQATSRTRPSIAIETPLSAELFVETDVACCASPEPVDTDMVITAVTMMSRKRLREFMYITPPSFQQSCCWIVSAFVVSASLRIQIKVALQAICYDTKYKNLALHSEKLLDTAVCHTVHIMMGRAPVIFRDCPPLSCLLECRVS